MKGMIFLLCDKCGKNTATTHIRSVINGVVTEKNLCSHCAAIEGYGNANNNNLSQMLFSMFDDTHKSKTTATRCECCGTTFNDIAQSGKCGCPDCYKTFYRQLLPYIKRVHGSTHHIGKTLDNTNCVKNDDTVDQLRNQLKQLIGEEKYEEAAIVRDKIKDLEANS